MQTDAEAYHQPVLPVEVLEYLRPTPGAVILDATVGGGGHSVLIASGLAPGGGLIGLDRDPGAIATAAERLEALRNSVSIILKRAAFGDLEATLRATEGLESVLLDGALFDLGMSSRLLNSDRGFSFLRDERLDMRYDRDSGRTAAEILAALSEADLAKAIAAGGETRWATAIARAIVDRRNQRRPVRTTGELVAAVRAAVPRAAWPRDRHVATRTFQSIRILVNDEYGQLEAGLRAAVARLAPAGRVLAISYHSGEDRRVKSLFAELSGRMPNPPRSSPAALSSRPGAAPLLRLLTPRPIVPSLEEVSHNPRARSAKLRAIERIAL